MNNTQKYTTGNKKLLLTVGKAGLASLPNTGVPWSCIMGKWRVCDAFILTGHRFNFRTCWCTDSSLSFHSSCCAHWYKQLGIACAHLKGLPGKSQLSTEENRDGERMAALWVYEFISAVVKNQKSTQLLGLPVLVMYMFIPYTFVPVSQVSELLEIYHIQNSRQRN